MAEAILTLYWTKLQLMFRPFRKLRQEPVQKKKLASAIAVEALHQAVLRAQAVIVWSRSHCLVNALALRKMLARRGIASVLHLGVAKENHRLHAHAWLECAGLDLVGAKTKTLFQPIASF